MKASIDIGTNTTLLLVAEVSDGILEILHEEQRVPRLGIGVDEAKILSGDAMKRVISALKEYQGLVSQNFPDVDSIQVTATSAVRDAKNRDDFLSLVKSTTGLHVQVLSGFDEALYTFLGAKSVLDNVGNANVVLDIGGGSTEVAYGNHKIRNRYSFDMGCVRFTERFLHDDPPTKAQIEACREAIQSGFEEYKFNVVDDATLIGVAGTVTSFAYIDKGLNTYKSSNLAGHSISINTITNTIRLFQKQSSEKLLKQYPEVMEGRADIFLAGLLILEGFMKKYGFEEIITSTGGIRHGVILDAK